MLFEVTDAQADVTAHDESASKGATRFSPVGDGTAAFLDDGMISSSVRCATGGGKRPDPSKRLFPEHPDGANYLFADGHVNVLRPDQVSTGTNATHPIDAQSGSVFGHAAGTEYPGYAATFSTR